MAHGLFLGMRAVVFTSSDQADTINTWRSPSSRSASNGFRGVASSSSSLSPSALNAFHAAIPLPSLGTIADPGLPIHSSASSSSCGNHSFTGSPLLAFTLLPSSVSMATTKTSSTDDDVATLHHRGGDVPSATFTAAPVGVHAFESALSSTVRRKSSTAAPAPVDTAHTRSAMDPGLCVTDSMTNGLRPPSSPNVGGSHPRTAPPSDATDKSPPPVDRANVFEFAARAMDGPMRGPSAGSSGSTMGIELMGLTLMGSSMLRGTSTA
mmetsp:Transcript_5993/g.26506  ORF Transcript_5993/g.26506 Transcript_5993/m.26506 type:complete len:266 (-) Transcript_5993:208-1005(-)